MDLSFLRDFPKRMRVVGLYAVVVGNSCQKQIWKTHGFEKFDEQINVIFAILLFIMERSLRDEFCTIDDISNFLIEINFYHFHKDITNENCKVLSQYIIDNILSNGGLQMTFDGFDFSSSQYKPINISYIGNRIVYENEQRRSSFYLTDNGYSLLLGTLEVESHMRLTIQEMIFAEHLKKNNYDKSLEDIKNIFEFIKIEKKKNVEAVSKIRRNILDFNIDDYVERLDATFKAIRETRKKLEKHKNFVKEKVYILENEFVDIDHIEPENLSKLKKLREINSYLDRSIECHLDIMQSYNEYRSICKTEMENFLKMSLVDRFSFSQGVFEKILDEPSLLKKVDTFLHPLFSKDPDKIFNLNKVLIPQHSRKAPKAKPYVTQIDFDEDKWLEEQKKNQEIKNNLYTNSLLVILESAREKNTTTLSELAEIVSSDQEKFIRLIPSVSIFKDLMIELIRRQTFDIEALKIERAKDLVMGKELGLATNALQIETLLLNLDKPWSYMKFFKVEKVYPPCKVCFTQPDLLEEGKEVRLVCSNVRFEIDFDV